MFVQMFYVQMRRSDKNGGKYINRKIRVPKFN